MRILLDGRPVRPPVSGVARYCIGLSNAMQKIPDIQVDNFIQTRLGNNIETSQLHGPHVSYPIAGSDKLFNIITETAAPLIPSTFYNSYDIIHETYFANLGTRKHLKVCTIHDIFPIEYPELYSPINRYFSARNLSRQLREANAVICVSKYTKDQILNNFDVRPEKLHIIGCGVNASAATNDGEAAWPIKGKIKQDLDFIFFMGNIEPRKNLDVLIRAWKKIGKSYPGVKLVFAGKKNYLADNTILKAEEVLGKDSFIYLGPITEKEKWTLLKNAKLFVFPSLVEGFGIPVLEAYLAECPIVFSNTSALTELATDKRQMFNPYSESELVAAIDRSLNTAEWVNVSRRKGKDIALRNTWHHAAMKTFKVYKSLY